jgi:hypothetical protein
MKSLSFGLHGALLFGTAAFLAACGGGPQSSAALSPSALRQAQGDRGVPRYVQRAVHPDRTRSSMSANAKSSKALLYVGDDETDDVYVYDYNSGKPVGTLTGFDSPYGECVDGKGDIYFANFDAGDVVEFAHGGTRVLNTYDSGGTPIGCSVDSVGDVAVTSFDPGEVTVFAGGDPRKGTSYTGPCEYFLTMGYDDKGNLVGGSESSSGGIEFCALLAGAKSITLLSTSGITIEFPGGTEWDGKYFVLGDQEAGGNFQTGLVRATLKDTTLTYVSETILSDDCYNDYVDVVNPFIVGKTNTLFKGKQGTTIIGPNLWCVDGGSGRVDYWHYPAGGLPYKYLSMASADPYGSAVSIAK